MTYLVVQCNVMWNKKCEKLTFSNFILYQSHCLILLRNEILSTLIQFRFSNQIVLESNQMKILLLQIEIKHRVKFIFRSCYIYCLKEHLLINKFRTKKTLNYWKCFWNKFILNYNFTFHRRYLSAFWKQHCWCKWDWWTE